MPHALREGWQMSGRTQAQRYESQVTKIFLVRESHLPVPAHSVRKPFRASVCNWSLGMLCLGGVCTGNAVHNDLDMLKECFCLLSIVPGRDIPESFIRCFYEELLIHCRYDLPLRPHPELLWCRCRRAPLERRPGPAPHRSSKQR
eukprot:2197847-Pleurochrysis_carterae.AAC.1